MARWTVAIAMLCAACPAPPAPAPIPPVRDCALEIAGSACNEDSDCNGIRCNEGCCAQHCFRDDDCQEGFLCATQRTQTCVRAPCNPLDASTCEGGVCFYEGGEARCALEAPLPASCIVTTSGVVTTSGRSVRLEALALDDGGDPAPWPPPTEWSASTGSFDGDALTADCSAGICRVDVTARIGDVACGGVVRVFPTLAAGRTRVIVVDASTRAPLAGVAVHMAIDGAFVVRDTDGDGVVEVNGSATIVSAFPDGHEWHSILDAPRDVVIVAAPLRDPTSVSGAKGTVDFDSMLTQGDIKIAFSGLALPSLVNLTREDVLGVPVATPVELEAFVNEVIVLPSPFTMNLGDNPIKGDWVALGAGRLLWTLGARALLADIGPALADDASFASLARAALPSLARGDHAILALGDRVDVARPPDGAAFGDWSFEEHVTTPSVVLLEERALGVSATEPDIVSVAFARVPGRGFVPLGIGNGADLSFAPPHDGLEGNEVLVAALALDLDALDAVRASFAPLGDELPPFLPHLEGTFDGVAFASTNVPDADMYRVRFDGWTVWSATPTSFALDDLHAGDVVFTATEARSEAIAGEALGFATMQELDRVTAVSSQPIGP